MIVFKIILLSLFAFGINIPLGYWRRNKKKFGFTWFVLIHASIPFIYPLRQAWKISFFYIPLFIALAVAGQLVGSKFFPFQKTAQK